jgi:hypothetical protein
MSESRLMIAPYHRHPQTGSTLSVDWAPSRWRDSAAPRPDHGHGIPRYQVAIEK